MDHVEDVIKKYNFKNMGGHDNFTNCEYDAREWSAPIIQKPKELMEYLKAIGIIGTTIKDIASTEYYLRRYTSDIAVGASVILTDKGAFEFDYSESSIVRAAKDTLPVAMYKKYLGLQPPKDIAKVFADLRGHKIVDIIIDEIDDATMDDDFTGSYGILFDAKQEIFIGELKFVLDNNLKLVLDNDYDSGIIFVRDSEDKIVK